MLRFALLGYPTLTLDGRPLDNFISQKALVLLCYLALEPRAHARESLAGLFWGEMPQDRALSNLRQALHNIQKLAPDYVGVNRQTVHFDTARSHTFDVAALDGGDPQAALAAYRDSFMAGIAIGDAEDLDQWISVRRETYRLRAIGQFHRLLDNALHQHDWQTVEAVALRLIALDPYAESAYRSLWRSYVHAGNAIAALTGYQMLCERLSQDLGGQPAPETQRFAQRLKIAQETPRHNIPAAPSLFFGREREIAQAQTWLADESCRLVTLLGIGGVGKSRLAQKIGRHAAGSMLNGTIYVPLAHVPNALYLPSALASAFGISLQGVANPLDAIAAFLAERELLVILDNAEHLPDLALWIENVLPAAPDIKFLVTSRHRLELREEWVLPVEGLSIQDEGGGSASKAVLAHHAQRGGYTAPLEPAQAEKLCALLEGVPLGIEMAGALLPEHPLAQLVDAVRANLDVLRQRWRNAEPRHISLRAAFDTSWTLLAAAEQAALAALSVFNGTFTAEAAAGVANTSAALLDKLQSKSLVKLADNRYSLHTVIRHYATEYREAAEPSRHSAYYLALLAQAETLFERREILAAVAMIQMEIDNIRQVWQTALEGRDLGTVEETIHTLHRFYEGSGAFTEGAAVFKDGIETLNLNSSDSREQVLLGKLQSHQAGMLLRLGRITEAHALARAGVDHLLRNENSAMALTFALNTLGITQLYTGDTTAAKTTLEECASIYRQLGRVERVKPLINLASVYTRTGDVSRARLLLEEAQPLAASIGDQVGGYHITNGLGVACTLLGDYASALIHYTNALGLSEATGFRQGKAITLNNLGDVHTLLGDAERGADYAAQAVEAARQIKDVRSITYALTTLALAQIALNMPEARATVRDALQSALDTGADPLQLTALYAFSRWQMGQRRAAEARGLWAYIAQHPSSEMDYRRRALAHLDGDTTKSTAELSPADWAKAALETLKTAD